jgi:hypothetical protein
MGGSIVTGPDTLSTERLYSRSTKKLHKKNMVHKRSAVFAYSVFKNIRQHATREINAFVSARNKLPDCLRKKKVLLHNG